MPHARDCARHDLTGSQRKQYAAEIGRLLSELAEKSDGSNPTDAWLDEILQRLHIHRTTLYDWWRSFCTEQAYAITPSQALDGHTQQFYDWLEAQHRNAEEEKARKAKEAAEHQHTAMLQAWDEVAETMARRMTER